MFRLLKLDINVIYEINNKILSQRGKKYDIIKAKSFDKNDER